MNEAYFSNNSLKDETCHIRKPCKHPKIPASSHSLAIVGKETAFMAMSTAPDIIRLVVFNVCFSEVQVQNAVHLYWRCCWNV